MPFVQQKTGNAARAILLAAISFSTLACTGVKPPIEPRADPYDRQQVHVSSEDLRRSTAIGTPLASRDDAGNILYITLPIRSATNQTLYVDYRVTFFDASGQVLNQTTWFTKTLEANTPDQIRVNSLGGRAADFQIDLRYAK